ncbi:allene oxide cyclase barrel-like domain-containing protein [Streptomyces sp. HC307]|uniref:allene oxide cyclase barrel-like domain-containing protein n=1 Tax=Streptomyces flavusporus TaxID=3385496 RepID=UPI003916D24F
MSGTFKINKMRFLSVAAGITAAIAAVFAIAPLAPANASASGSAPDTQQRTRVIQLVGKQTQIEDIDLGKEGVGLGDQRVVAEDLYRDGKKVGDHSVICTTVHVNPGQLQCVGTFALPGGQFTSQALLHLPAPSSVDVAITGGTGDYRNTQGYIRTTPAGETERQLTVHIKR